MALYMFFYVAPENHLEFLSENPTLFDSYLVGEPPDLKQDLFSRLLGKQPPELPDDWPTHELESYCPEISHRQVNAYHYILNGSSDPVETVGSLFQTWFKPRHKHPALVIDGENFALSTSDVKQLLNQIKGLDPETMHDRFHGCADASEIHGLDSVKFAFDEIEKACNQAIAKGQGLLWSNR